MAPYSGSFRINWAARGSWCGSGPARTVLQRRPSFGRSTTMSLAIRRSRGTPERFRIKRCRLGLLVVCMTWTRGSCTSARGIMIPSSGGGQANLYVYSNNDSVNHRDPSGLRDWNEREVQQILSRAISGYRTPDWFARFDHKPRFEILCEIAGNSSRFGYDGKYDYKYNNSEDTFWVPGLGPLDAGQFGNYFAGYVNSSVGLNLGSIDLGGPLTHIGGTLTHAGDGPAWGDDEASFELIERGIHDARHPGGF